MLRIDRAAVDALSKASTAEEVATQVWQAIRLEFATIPPYLTAMISLKPGTNRDIWRDIHGVVVDEMLHMAIGCNLLNALGGSPVIADECFVPTYPDPLPLGIAGGMEVGLERYSRELVKRVFMEIEEPEDPLVFRGAAREADEAATIGEFYRTLKDALVGLGDGAFGGDPDRQLVAPQWFPAERLFPIVGVESAVRALDLVVAEGEGSAVSPVDPDGDVAHFYRFEAIFRGRRLKADPAAPLGFSFTGAEYPFDANGVWPLTPNQQLDQLAPRTEVRRRAHHFQVVFTRLLVALQRVFDGDPGHLDAAMGVMFELKLAGQALAGMPATADPAGPTAGPVFGFAIENA